MGDRRVRLVDRIARVLLDRFAPRLLMHLSREAAASWWREGLVLAVHHASLGAQRAATLGCSERTCWLIAYHADRPFPPEDLLRLLVAADDACP